MADIDGLPYWEVTFDKQGALIGDTGLREAVAGGGLTDLFVMSHGWNNSVAGARDLYQAMFTLLSGQLTRFGPDRRDRAGVVGVLWPSLLFPDDAPGGPAAPTGAQVAAAIAPAFPDQESAVHRIGALLDDAAPDPDQLDRAHQLMTTLVTTPDENAPEDAGMDALTTASTAVLFGHLASLAAPNTGDAQGIGNIFKGLWHGAKEALRATSYYEMKNRAGVVGQRGLGPLLGTLQSSAAGIRVHLIGHSFGGRLVAFSLAGLPDSAGGVASPVKSLLLVQAAFSHFTFADPIPVKASVPKGYLVPYRGRVDGPLLSTFSAADLAVGRWYPTASMINGDDAQSISDLTYRWGAMGHDGFQQEGVERLDLKPAGEPYAFAKGTAYALASDQVIKAMQSSTSGAHSDIRHDEVIWPTVAAALAAS